MVRGVVARDAVDRAVGEAGEERPAVGFGAQGGFILVFVEKPERETSSSVSSR